MHDEISFVFPLLRHLSTLLARDLDYIDVTNIDVMQIVLGKQSYPLYCGGQDLLHHGERINRFVSVHHLHRYGW